MTFSAIKHFRRAAVALMVSLLFIVNLSAQNVPAPSDIIGFDPGENYKLADNDQLERYYRALAEASERVLLKEIGETHHGNQLLMLIISSEENLQNLDRYREISTRLARAHDLSEEEARELAKEGKAVVWIDSGLHSPELAHGQHNPHFAYHMATDESEETRTMRDEVILLNMPMMNPDGHDIVVDWYREHRDTEFEQTSPPVVYHEYIGHDNNRDWYMLLQNESRAVAEQIYNTWYPQIVVNHHQMGEIPARMFIPPFADPVNPNIPPLAVRGTNLVGEHMANRFAAEGKSGIIQGITFNMWWNGGMRTAPYFHNMVGILTESTHRSPVPKYWDEEDIPETITRGNRVISMKEPSVFYPDPWEGGWASMQQMVDYHLTASLGVMDIAMKRKNDWLMNIYLMGRDAIEKGSEGGPYAYVITPDQWDRGEAVKLLNVLQRGGIEIHRASSSFSAEGETYPEGSYVIYAAQAFRPYLIDLMEPQSYPDRRLYPGGPPEPPYDMAGWTLPIQMGVDVSRIEAPASINTDFVDTIEPFRGTVRGSGNGGYLVSASSNYTAMLLNRLLESDHQVYRLAEEVEHAGHGFIPGSLIVERKGDETDRLIRSFSRDYGIDAAQYRNRPSSEAYRVHQPKVGMYQSWTAHIDEGWTRWIFDQYGFDYETLHDADIRDGDLSRFDIIILPALNPSTLLSGNAPGRMPEKYTGGLGVEGAFQLKKYTENGGTVLAWDGATDFLIEQFGLPVRNRIANRSQDQFFIPGSLVGMTTDASHINGFGMQDEHAAFFVTRRGSQSRAFSIVNPVSTGDYAAEAPPVEVFARYADSGVLLSGWALGEEQFLAGHPAAVRVAVGDGEVVLIGVRPQFRAQPRATFKYIFNAIYNSSSEGIEPAVSSR